jgi:hypothetical protein
MQESSPDYFSQVDDLEAFLATFPIPWGSSASLEHTSINQSGALFLLQIGNMTVPLVGQNHLWTSLTVVAPEGKLLGIMVHVPLCCPFVFPHVVFH